MNPFVPRIVSKAEARKRAAKDLMREIDLAVVKSEERIRELRERKLKNNVTLESGNLALHKKIQALLGREIVSAQKEMDDSDEI